MDQIRTKWKHPLLGALGLAALFACGDPTGSGGGGGGTGALARLDVVSGDLQTTVAGTELPQPLVVRVVDDKGKPVRGQVVNFRVTAGSGSVFAGAASTNADGEARERWTLGTVAGDTQRVEVRAVDAATGAAQVFATFRAVATADVPAAVAIVQVNPFTGMAGLPLADSVIARVNDRYGNPVVGATVVWTVRAGGGSASPTQGTTDAAGRARTSWTLGTRLDSVQVLEAAAGLTLKTQAQAAATGLAGGSVSKVSGDAQTGAPATPLAQPLVVVVRAAGGAPVRGASVTWSTPNGSLAPATSATDANGQASARWTLAPRAGTMTASVAVAGVGVATFTATSVGGAPALLDSIGVEGYANFGASMTLKVRARDAQGYPAAGAVVQWKVLNGGGSVPAQSTADADGIATATWQLGPATLTQGAVASIPGGESRVFVARPTGPLGPLLKVAGDGQDVIIQTYPSTPLAVRFAAPVAGYYINWRAYLNGSATPFVDRNILTDADGISRFQFLPGSLGTVRVVASNGITTQEFTETIVANPPWTLKALADTVWLGSLHETQVIGAVLFSGGGGGTISQDRGDWGASPLDANGAAEIRGTGNITVVARALANGVTRFEAQVNPRRVSQAYADQFRHDTFTVVVRQRLSEANFVDNGMQVAVVRPGQRVTVTGRDTRVFDGTTNFSLQSTIDDIVWTSSDPSVATVSGSSVTAVGLGAAAIQGTAGGATRTLYLVVTP